MADRIEIKIPVFFTKTGKWTAFAHNDPNGEPIDIETTKKAVERHTGEEFFVRWIELALDLSEADFG